MALTVKLHDLEAGSVRLKEAIPAGELDLDKVDELIRVDDPLACDLEVQKLDDAILARGRITLTLKCECCRCLRPFEYVLDFPDWACHLPLTGDDRVPVVNDGVDLTPQVREDILLEFPQHPLCEPGCGGLSGRAAGDHKAAGAAVPAQEKKSAWDDLNKLKF